MRPVLTRKQFLIGAASSLATPAIWRSGRARAQGPIAPSTPANRANDLPCPPPDPDPQPPKFQMPAGAIDTHAHLFGPASRYPYSERRGYTPPDANIEAYRALHQALRVSRGVLTQPSVYGTDNARILDALRQEPNRLRAVVSVEASVTDREIEQMNALGVRGIRVNLVDKGGMPYSSLDDVEVLARRIHPFGWHVELLVHVHEDAGLMRRLASMAADISIGHLGYMPAALGADHPGFQAFLAILREGRCWVKLTGSYRITALKATPYGDVTPLARALVAARPDRIVWGTDWPHPIVRIPMPNDGALLDQLADWVPDEAIRNRILVDNAAQLYGF
jgi:2-pyrone-4,6-dicarboxylate lactonase